MFLERLQSQHELCHLLGLKTVPTNFEGMSLMRLQAGIRLASADLIRAEPQSDGAAQIVKRALPADAPAAQFISVENDWRLFAEADASYLLAFANGRDRRELLRQFANQEPLPQEQRPSLMTCIENSDGTADWITEAAKSVEAVRQTGKPEFLFGGVQPQCSDRSDTSHSAGNGTSAE